MKNVQIPNHLFVALVQYHLMGNDDCTDTIQQGLEKKLNSLVLHDLYEKSKTTPTEEEREKVRQEYLDRRGVRDSFRW